MFRYRTLFLRISCICIGVLLVSLVLLNVFVSFGVRNRAIGEVQERLLEGTTIITRAFLEYYETGATDEELFLYLRDQASKRSGSIWIGDAFGNITIELNYDENYGNYAEYAKKNLEQIEGRIAEESPVYAVYDAEGNYYTPVVTIGNLISLNGVRIGAIYMNGQVSGISGTIQSIRRWSLAIFFLGTAASLLLAFYMSRKISRPLYDMNRAAKEMAKGNFDQKIEVNEHSEIGQLSETFNSMARALKKYEDTRQSFVGNVSHELKSPLTSIQGFIQGMLDGTIKDEDRNSYLEIVLSETKRMNALIVDLLELVKIESDQFPMHMTDWDVNELLRKGIITFINKIEEKNIELSVDISENKTMVYADEDRITQVVTNLLDNAVKFCEKGGNIKIWTSISSDKVTVNISNSGKIIPEEDLKYIFDRFFKVDKSHNRKTPGTGIGLSIVKEIINRHDENIWVNSKEGMGTVFSFTLTLSDAKETR